MPSFGFLYIYNYLMQLFQALVVLIMSIGLKETMKTIYKFPPIILTPIFSIWTIGPVMPTKSRCCSCCTCCCNSHQKLGVSICLTWINLLLTFLSGLAYSIMLNKGAFGIQYHNIFPWFLKVFCPCLIISMIFLILLQCLDKCPGYCGPCLPCCDSYCYPVTEFTYLDVNHMDAIITQDDIELEQLNM